MTLEIILAIVIIVGNIIKWIWFACLSDEELAELKQAMGEDDDEFT